MRIGLLGEKLSHSLSPQIHNYIYKSIFNELNYELFEVDKNKINNFPQFMVNNKIFAVNITVPYKKIFLDKLDFISESAKKISAINLMYIKNNKFYGDNTDYFGFKYTLEKNNIDVKNKKIYILGKGGASRAVEAVLQDMGANEIYYLFRKDKNSSVIFEKNIKGDIFINCTPVGMYPNIEDNIVPAEILKNFKIAIDLIYNPLETKFLSLASSLGLKTINGLDMLIEQAIKTDEILFNKKFENNLRENLKRYLEDYFSGVVFNGRK